MKKFVISIVMLIVSTSCASALSCVDIGNNLTRGDESDSVRTLQNFLMDKGLLTVAPNGYFGPSTLKAAIEYQKSIGLPSGGYVYSLTRKAIKDETCSNSNQTSSSNAVTSSVTNTTQTTVLSQTQNSSCVDIKYNLNRGAENDDVRTLQNYLMKKGFLMVAPNGYFGPSTQKAVTDYQKSMMLSSDGEANSLTRLSIRNETCGGQVSVSTSQPTTVNSPTSVVSSSLPVGCSTGFLFSVVTGQSCSSNVISASSLPAGCTSSSLFSTISGVSCSTGISSNNNQVTTVISVPVATTSIVTTSTVTQNVVTVPRTKNEQRQADVNSLLSSMYLYFQDSRGAYPIALPTSVPIELCTLGISLCDNLNQIKYSLVPRFLPSIPVDPTLATSSMGSGYFITRSSDGTIVVSAPKADGGESIFAKCNFNAGCKITTAKDVSTVLGKPQINSMGQAIFLSGANMSIPLTINGSEFSSTTNTVTLTLQSSRKAYTLGVFPSADGKTINATTSFTNTELSCGTNCLERLQPGVYEVNVKTTSGESNAGYIQLQSVTSSSYSNGSDVSFRPLSTHMKLGTVTLSSAARITLKSLKFSLTGTTSLVSKVSNFTITDLTTGKITNSGPIFVISDEVISDYRTKIYELYADIADIESYYAGRVEIGGEFVATEQISGSTVTIPIPKFTITISY
ncbi:peptidoglycan-binding protein [Candidatus Gracilibacteria bacterium]|nr:peptidoglycan-binding protein [Candidatus Gracilibacteria bacterium]MCF7898541.1 peptidoglycan-binding protein [Candidatus Paceibacterota bacterium]